MAFAAVRSPDELLRFVIDHGPLTDLPFRIFEQVPSAKNSSPNDPVSEELMYSALDSVHHGLGYAEIFRGLLRLKVQSSPRKLTSSFESKTSSDFDTIGSLLGSLQLVGDSKRGIRFKMGPPDLLGALWFQLGLNYPMRHFECARFVKACLKQAQALACAQTPSSAATSTK